MEKRIVVLEDKVNSILQLVKLNEKLLKEVSANYKNLGKQLENNNIFMKTLSNGSDLNNDSITGIYKSIDEIKKEIIELKK